MGSDILPVSVPRKDKQVIPTPILPAQPLQDNGILVVNEVPHTRAAVQVNPMQSSVARSGLAPGIPVLNTASQGLVRSNTSSVRVGETATVNHGPLTAEQMKQKIADTNRLYRPRVITLPTRSALVPRAPAPTVTRGGRGRFQRPRVHRPMTNPVLLPREGIRSPALPRYVALPARAPAPAASTVRPAPQAARVGTQPAPAGIQAVAVASSVTVAITSTISAPAAVPSRSAVEAKLTASTSSAMSPGGLSPAAACPAERAVTASTTSSGNFPITVRAVVPIGAIFVTYFTA